MEETGKRTLRVGVLGGDGLWSVAEVLRSVGVTVVDLEPAPKQVAEAVARRWHYGRASVRAGLLGLPRAILQLLQEAQGRAVPGWMRDGVDALRPEVDPEPLEPALMGPYRQAHLAAVARLPLECDRLILPLCRARGHGDGTNIFGGPFEGLSEVSFAAADLRRDLHEISQLLHQANPHLAVQMTLQPSLMPGGALPDLGELPGHDPVFDALLSLQGKRGGGLLKHLAEGGSLDAPVAAAPQPVPQSAPADDRKKRRKERRRAESPGKVICEDELLEAFAK